MEAYSCKYIFDTTLIIGKRRMETDFYRHISVPESALLHPMFILDHSY
jgi:hypothetical protein